MAVLKFDGTTLWDDSGTGFGAADVTQTPRKRRRVYAPLPRTGEVIAKPTGFSPGALVVSVKYRCTKSQWSSILSTVDGLLDDEGTVDYPVTDGSSASTIAVTNMVLDDWTWRKGPVSLSGGGTLRHDYYVQFAFVKLS
jgi:hypothetical protein